MPSSSSSAASALDDSNTSSRRAMPVMVWVFETLPALSA